MTTLSLNDEQRAQIEEGRRRASEDRHHGDLSGNSAQKPRKGPSKPQRPQSKSKPAPTGHDALLEKIKNLGGSVRIRFLDCDYDLTGKVTHSDKFTLSVLVEHYAGTSYAEGQTAVVFKHAMASFVPVEKKENV